MKNINSKTLKNKGLKRETSNSLLSQDTLKSCPICKTSLSSSIFHNVEVDYCQKCLGIWFDEDELRWAKDNKESDLKWHDIDLWEDKSKFKVSQGIRLCPSCRMPLYELYYGDSRIIVDVCAVCHGVWLDRLEFKKIIEYLKDDAQYRMMKKYTRTLFQEMAEVFSGPETLREELEDFLGVLRVMGYKFSAGHPVFSKLMLDLPK